MTDEELIILRCACRDWPCHVEYAYTKLNGRCGLCGVSPEVVAETYSGPNYQEQTA